jgi:hypothetical protein
MALYGTFSGLPAERQLADCHSADERESAIFSFTSNISSSGYFPGNCAGRKTAYSSFTPVVAIIFIAASRSILLNFGFQVMIRTGNGAGEHRISCECRQNPGFSCCAN